MKILQLGAGSMGTRRLRDLSARPGMEVRLFDARADRRERARTRFGIEVFATLAEALAWEPEALVISTPPGTKGPLVELALERKLHHFVEADIWSYGVAERVAQRPELVSAPSLTFGFLPVFKALKEIVPSTLGSLLGYQFSLAGDMAAWHPEEGAEYYGRHRDTAPAREMMPFELSWLFQVFGPPTKVVGGYGRFSGRADSFEDTWSLQLQLPNGGTGQITVTMACPNNYRCGCAFGINGHATWDINRGEIKLQGATGAARLHSFGEISQVIEPAYAAEINAFIDAAQGGPPWLHRYAEYQFALATLAAAEASVGAKAWTPIEAGSEPARILPRLPVR